MVTAYRVPATYRSINMWGAVVSGIFLAYQLLITSFAQIPITGEGMTGLFFLLWILAGTISVVFLAAFVHNPHKTGQRLYACGVMLLTTVAIVLLLTNVVFALSGSSSHFFVSGYPWTLFSGFIFLALFACEQLKNREGSRRYFVS
ncbi:MAG: hypothetical protein QF387_04910 [Arenicellales bacterium]|mgnify:FL=1|nr:hypothetical protein [Arenicellales bacterium]